MIFPSFWRPQASPSRFTCQQIRCFQQLLHGSAAKLLEKWCFHQKTHEGLTCKYLDLPTICRIGIELGKPEALLCWGPAHCKAWGSCRSSCRCFLNQIDWTSGSAPVKCGLYENKYWGLNMSKPRENMSLSIKVRVNTWQMAQEKHLSMWHFWDSSPGLCNLFTGCESKRWCPIEYYHNT